jgi:putative NIF3 family GTP cyclohydrolase 1 type 2
MLDVAWESNLPNPNGVRTNPLFGNINVLGTNPASRVIQFALKYSDTHLSPVEYRRYGGSWTLSDISRRHFILQGSSALLGAQVAASQTMQVKLTAGEVVDRIHKQVKIPWRAKTVDQIVAGNENTPVQGIASTMMATLDVVERAVLAGKNMIVTHETPFYLHQDQTDDITNDPTYQYKLDFIRRHNVAIFHFHDHWHARNPDGIAVGMTQALGWERNVDPENPKRFTFLGEPLAHFCQNIQSQLNARTIRVVGNPKMPVKNVLASWGYVSRMPGIPMFARPDVDVLICGETREWELVEYAQDSITAGNHKALILLGHVLSEQGGMVYCTEWLKGFIPEVAIEFIPAREPFWNPTHPVSI